ncbi:hypothetical protein CDAR_207591 [Caerostris darwini]|uniref:Uncharacterized protein n=1 Tax=Caerostris darwini TaxID=1538125 RepID=A0AAV4VH62_9ARAC|nr:hypothetical protein CDAR_207591 [Caerostris darwini]
MVSSVEKADDDSSLFEEGTYLASQHAFKHLGQRLWQEGVLSFDCAIQFRCLCMNGDPTLSLSMHSSAWIHFIQISSGNILIGRRKRL